jgi:16S rRNA (guanine(527)-N(7))-methyltransferase RsmG
LFFAYTIYKKDAILNAVYCIFPFLIWIFFVKQVSDFLKSFSLSPQQLEQLATYAQFLISENEKFNITAITSLEDVYKLHFYDSLMLSKQIDLNQVTSFADVGCGGGFPGIPLKIMFPHLTLHAIEVNEKKAAFLRMVARELGLANVQVHTCDWRTFLRTVDLQIDIFVARASLQVEELLKVFKPSSPYKSTKLFYWASAHWVPEKKEEAFVVDKYGYVVAGRKRFLICFQNQE